MTRGVNAQLAVDLYKSLQQKHGWGAHDAWKGIAYLLLSCEIYESKRTGWQPFHKTIVIEKRTIFLLKMVRQTAHCVKQYGHFIPRITLGAAGWNLL